MEGVGTLSQLGVETRPARHRDAVAVVLLFVILTVLAIRYGATHVVELHAFVPICATLWSSAELITAFLLVSQFYVARTLGYALLATAYALASLLTVPYVVAFPGTFPLGPLLADTQLSAWLWIVWNTAFAVGVGTILAIDPTFERHLVSRANVSRTLWSLSLGVIAAAALITLVLTLASYTGHLPPLVDRHNHYTLLYRLWAAPAVIVTNAGVFAFVLFRLAKPTPLQLWIGVGALTTALEASMNAVTQGRYTIAWYIGNAEAVFTACIVLAVLFQHVSRLYRRLLDIASIDALTGLDNRRTLDLDIAAFTGSRRKTQGAALLLIDLDNFKHYNDRYGNVAGDEALRTVAAVLRSSIYRTSDAVARYGGETFAVLLRDTELESARAVAERVRRNIETTVLRIGARSSHITASIGVAYVATTASYSSDSLLAAADRALYHAKDEGRNRVCVDGGPSQNEMATSFA